MAEQAAVAVAEQAAVAEEVGRRPAEKVPAEERGTLTIKDKVVERLATKAALDTAGVVARSQGLDKLTGRDLPRVEVHISGNRVRAGLDIAVLWPTPLAEVMTTVRHNVARALTDLGGLQVDGIDVAVPAIVVDSTSVHDPIASSSHHPRGDHAHGTDAHGDSPTDDAADDPVNHVDGKKSDSPRTGESSRS